MTHIRPYQLFGMLETPPGDRTANIMLPFRRAAGGITLLETALLVCMSKIVRAKRIFEFGTYFGSTTYNLALNIPDDGLIYTLDLEDPGIIQHESDAQFAIAHLEAAKAAKLDFDGTPEKRKIRRLKGNSRDFHFYEYRNSMDLVFVDGGHDLETVRNDTAAARGIARMDKPSFVAWHDYGNPDYPELTRFLDKNTDWPLVHVEDTMLSFCSRLTGTPK